MKVALCLHGYFKNAGGVEASIRGHDYITSKLLKYDVDTFIHSWDLENEDLVKSLYKPKHALFEKQIQFEEELKIVKQSDFFGLQGEAPGMYKTNNTFKALSFLYSRKATMHLKKEYEKDNKFKYDCVILARFDLGQRGKEHSQKYYATNFNFNPSLDMNFLYSAFWNQLNHGFADHWFYSNSKNMDKVSRLYDKVVEYYQLDSEYVEKVTNGWPDSNSYDDFSNEFFNSHKCNSPKTWPLWACIDNHKLYKWYFIDSGLYNKCKFIDITRDLK